MRAPAATRQLAARARAHVQIDRPRHAVPRDIGATLHADGGGKVQSVLNVIDGAAPILRMFAALSRKFGAEMELLGMTTIDGLPGVISRIAGSLQTTALESGSGLSVTFRTSFPPCWRTLSQPG